MKQLIRIFVAILIFAGCLALMPGCCTTPGGQTYFCFNNVCAYKMAFGGAIRSLEGSVLAQDATKIPGAIQSLANTWLPKNSQFAQFINTDVIQPFIAAHPVTVDEVNKVLETIAMTVQSGC